jgi:hypothetical protein
VGQGMWHGAGAAAPGRADRTYRAGRTYQAGRAWWCGHAWLVLHVGSISLLNVYLSIKIATQLMELY